MNALQQLQQIINAVAQHRLTAKQPDIAPGTKPTPDSNSLILTWADVTQAYTKAIEAEAQKIADQKVADLLKELSEIK